MPLVLKGDDRYTMAELVKLRRTMLRYSRSVSPGPERNQHLQIAISLRRLFKNKAWLAAHTVEASSSHRKSIPFALEINIALWGMIVCGVFGAAQYFNAFR